MNPQIWDTGNCTPQQRTLVQAALAGCNFDWGLLLPGLKLGNQWSQPGRTSIPVSCRDLSGVGAAQSEDYHAIAVDDMGRVASEEDSAATVLGRFWFDGRVEIDQSLVNNPALFAEVFLSEGAHASDFYYLLPNNLRPTLNAIYHPNGPDAHGFFTGPYFDTVGEAYMGGFVYATTGRPPTLLGFTHVSTASVAIAIKQLLKIDVPPAPPQPGSEPTLRGATNTEFNTEFNRRYGFFKDFNLGFTKSEDRWYGKFIP